jgi:hypothetical protein
VSYGLKDKTFIGTKALPNGAATVNSTGFDLGAITSKGGVLAEVELLISLPALTTTELPDTKTMKVDVQCDSDVAFGSPKTLAKTILTQTGAGGAGAAAATVRYRFPTDCERYVRVNATNDGAGDCSGKNLTEELLF